MMNIVVRRSSFASTISKRTLAALTSVQSFHHLLHPSSPSSSSAAAATEFVDVAAADARNGAFGGGEIGVAFTRFGGALGLSNIGARSFHSGSRRLDFQASVISQAAEYAAARDISYDDAAAPKGSSSSDDGLEIAKLGIASEIVTALAKKGITKLFPIQKAVMEPAMQGRDMIGRAKTGTGKTLAFGIPILDRIIQYNAKHGRGKYPLALVLAPTRELAKQVEKEFYESAPTLDTICVYGGTPIQRQMSSLDYGVDVVVGTPGRIIDLIKRGALVLSEVQFLVLDEADQMLAVGFDEDVEVILDKLPQNRQSMMFSATMPTWIKKLTQKHLKNPLTIDLVGDSDQKLAEGITLYSIASDSFGRASIIGPLITEHAKGGKCIVFTGTKRDADRLAFALGKSLRCEALHGDISQQQRERTLSGFRDGNFNVLCATDVASRGLDIPNVDLVIHYEIPNSSEIFVHRSGRTGRAGKKGTAILIYTDQQRRSVQLIEREIGSRFSELPKISVEGGVMLSDMGGGGSSRFGSYGSKGGGGFSGFGSGRSGGYGGSGGGRSSGYGGSGFGRSGSYGGSSSGRMGEAGESDSGRFGSFGSGRSGGGFGGSSQRSSSNSGGFGFSRSGSFGDTGSSYRSSGFGDSSSGRSGGFGDGQNTGRRSY